MAGKLDIYQLGLGGINIVKQSLQPADDELLQSQNAEVKLDTELGGIATLSKRDGLADLGDTLGSSIAEMAEVRFINEDDISGGTDVTFRPISDISNIGDTGWTTAPLFSKLDEVSPDDVDFINAFVLELITPNICVMGLTSTVFTGAATGGTLRIRCRWNDNGASYAPLTTLTSISIGTAALPTIVGSGAQFVEEFTSSFQTLEYDIVNDLNYAGSSFDWSALRISLLVNPSSIGGSIEQDSIDVSWIELVLTHL